MIITSLEITSCKLCLSIHGSKVAASHFSVKESMVRIHCHGEVGICWKLQNGYSSPGRIVLQQSIDPCRHAIASTSITLPLRNGCHKQAFSLRVCIIGMTNEKF